MAHLSTADLARVRCANNRLSAPVDDPVSVAGTIGGIQAQDMGAAELAIRARSPGRGTAAEIREAVGDGRLVVTWTLRGTRHLHPAGQVRAVLDVVGPVFRRESARDRELGIAGDVGERAIETLRHALAHGPLTRPEVKEVLAPLGIDTGGQAPIHVVQRAALQGVLSILPTPGRPASDDRYALLDDVVPGKPQDPPAPDEGLAKLRRLVEAYLLAYAPAAFEDFLAWSGFPVSLARKGWEAPEPISRHHDGPPAPAPLRVAGAFDPLLLGYADRSAHLPVEHARRVNAGGGMVKPVVYQDARVVATWAWARTARGRRMVVAPLPDTRIDRDALEAEAHDIARFLAEPVSLEIAR